MEDCTLAFTDEGLLPPRDYWFTLAALAKSMLVTGDSDGCGPCWDLAWRAQLVENLGVLVRQLWQVGIEEIFVNGSFVENKNHPNDIDGYFVCEPEFLFSGVLERGLHKPRPHEIWTWDPASRRPYRGYPKRQLPMWHAYRVELYPHYGQLSGIVDEYGYELIFPSAFRQCRATNAPKGIVELIKD